MAARALIRLKNAPPSSSTAAACARSTARGSKPSRTACRRRRSEQAPPVESVEERGVRRLAFIFVPRCWPRRRRFAAARLAYPDAPRDPKPDTYFGTTVPDPYRWLENVDAPQTTGLGARRGRPHPLVSRRGAAARRRSETPTASCSTTRRSARRSARASAGSSPATAACRTRACSTCATASARRRGCCSTPTGSRPTARSRWRGQSFTNDGRYMAYATQASGSDWQTWHVRDVASGKDLRRPAGVEQVLRRDLGRRPRLLLRRLRRAQRGQHDAGRARRAEAVLPRAGHAAGGRRAGLRVDRASRRVRRRRARPRTSATSSSAPRKGDGNSLAWKRPGEPDSAFRPLFALDPNVQYDVVGDDGTRLYLHTNAGAPRSRLVVGRPRRSAPRAARHRAAERRRARGRVADRQPLLPELPARRALADAHHRPARQAGRHDRAARDRQRRPAARAPRGPRRVLQLRLVHVPDARSTATTRGPARARCTSARRSRSTRRRTSPSSTSRPRRTARKVPVFVTHRSDMPLDGSTPTIVYGYGGFDINETPGFSFRRRAVAADGRRVRRRGAARRRRVRRGLARRRAGWPTSSTSSTTSSPPRRC